MFCPVEKDYYLAAYTLVALLLFYKICLICTQLPFYAVRMNSYALSYTLYELILVLGMMGLPFVPTSVQPLLPFSIILFVQLPLRLSKHFISSLLQYLVRPVTSARTSSPNNLLLFTSLLNYYKQDISNMRLSSDTPNDDLPLLLTLVGIMAHHSLPSCSVLSTYLVHPATKNLPKHSDRPENAENDKTSRFRLQTTPIRGILQRDIHKILHKRRTTGNAAFS